MPELHREKSTAAKFTVIGVLARAVVAAMGCFLACFRTKEPRSRRPGLDPPLPHVLAHPLPTDPVVAWKRNRLSSLLLSPGGDEADDSLYKPRESSCDVEALDPGLDMKYLRLEAEFLKACGTLPETPVEIRKVSERWEDLSEYDEELEPVNSNPCLPNTSIEKSSSETQLDQPPTIITIDEGSEEEPDHSSSFTQNDFSSTTGVHDVTQASSSTASSGSPSTLAPSVQCKHKSVRFFECESDVCSLPTESNSSEFSEQFDKSGNRSVSKPSPYPTPLKLTDDMQTPGTVFPAYLDCMSNGKKPRIRSQYVYSVLNPVERFSEWEVAKGCESDGLPESFEQTHEDTNISDLNSSQTKVGNDLLVEASLSSWLKSSPSDQDRARQNYGIVSDEYVQRGKTPKDRPILGMVAAHWIEEQAPKWWDGNGIPNSTNKYKEDQKVSWHATPFEERLEKALSDENFFPRRKRVDGSPPIDFSETEKSDTASSRLQSSTQFKSVVSF